MTATARQKTALRAAGYGLLRVLLVGSHVLPLPMALAIGRKLGDFARIVSGKRYRVALKNMHIAFGDAMSESDRDRMARECFRQWGMFAMESLKLAFASSREIEQRMRITGDEHMEEALAAGRGCICVTAHLGAFELYGRRLADQGYDVMALARRTRDEATTNLMTSIRERNNIRVVTIDQSMRPVFATLKHNSVVAIVCDQNSGDVIVPFFGHPTGTADGPARIALWKCTPILFVSTVRDGHGRYQTEVEGPYWPENTGDEAADIRRIMTAVNEHFEAAIRKHPEQWLWIHDRWRASPIDASLYEG